MDPEEIARGLVARLEEAWNAGDGAGFGAPFTRDADFVDIRGVWHSGAEIAAGHQQIFDTIYTGSRVSYEVLRARLLADGIVLAHVRGRLSAPTGPMAGENEALASIVIIEDGEGHSIAAFHNTLVASAGRR